MEHFVSCKLFDPKEQNITNGEGNILDPILSFENMYRLDK